MGKASEWYTGGHKLKFIENPGLIWIVSPSGRTAEPIKHPHMKPPLLVKRPVIKYPAIIASISLLDDLHVVLKLYIAGIHSPNIALCLQNQSKSLHPTNSLSFLFYQTGHLEDESTACVLSYRL